MRRSVTIALLVLASLSFAPLSPAGADDPGPTVILAPAPFEGPDAMIRAAGSSEWAGADSPGLGRIEQTITPSQRALSDVRVCANTTSGRMRVHGSAGGRNFVVRYRVGSHDVTRSVVAGSYHTRSLHGGACAPRIRVVARLRSGHSSPGRTLRIVTRSVSGARDSVATHVAVSG